VALLLVLAYVRVVFFTEKEKEPVLVVRTCVCVRERERERARARERARESIQNLDYIEGRTLV